MQEFYHHCCLPEEVASSLLQHTQTACMALLIAAANVQELYHDCLPARGHTQPPSNSSSPRRSEQQNVQHALVAASEQPYMQEFADHNCLPARGHSQPPSHANSLCGQLSSRIAGVTTNLSVCPRSEQHSSTHTNMIRAPAFRSSHRVQACVNHHCLPARGRIPASFSRRKQPSWPFSAAQYAGVTTMLACLPKVTFSLL